MPPCKEHVTKVRRLAACELLEINARYKNGRQTPGNKTDLDQACLFLAKDLHPVQSDSAFPHFLLLSSVNQLIKLNELTKQNGEKLKHSFLFTLSQLKALGIFCNLN